MGEDREKRALHLVVKPQEGEAVEALEVYQHDSLGLYHYGGQQTNRRVSISLSVDSEAGRVIQQIAQCNGLAVAGLVRMVLEDWLIRFGKEYAKRKKAQTMKPEGA